MYYLRSNVNSIAVDNKYEFLYFSAATSPHLFRVPLSALLNSTTFPDSAIESVERYSSKPVSSGLAVHAG